MIKRSPFSMPMGDPLSTPIDASKFIFDLMEPERPKAVWPLAPTLCCGAINPGRGARLYS